MKLIHSFTLGRLSCMKLSSSLTRHPALPVVDAKTFRPFTKFVLGKEPVEWNASYLPLTVCATVDVITHVCTCRS